MIHVLLLIFNYYYNTCFETLLIYGRMVLVFIEVQTVVSCVMNDCFQAMFLSFLQGIVSSGFGWYLVIKCMMGFKTGIIIIIENQK